MNNYAIIENSIVVNVAVSSSALEWNWVLIPEGSSAWIGWRYVGGEFLPPEE